MFRKTTVSLVLALGGCGGESLVSHRSGGPDAAPEEELSLARPSVGQCRVPWILQIDAENLNKQKPLWDNTNVAYVTFAFVANTKFRLRLAGEFPYAQFMSYQTQGVSQADGIYDFQLKADAGSSNPFVPGANIAATPRRYQLELRPEGSTPTLPNSIFFQNQPLQYMIFRVYAPNPGHTFTLADLPEVTAVDAATGQPTACPQFITTTNTTVAEKTMGILLGAAVSRKALPVSPNRQIALQWQSTEKLGGTNAATSYLTNNNKMLKGEVAVLRVKKTPSFVNVRSGTGPMPGGTEVRHWSICAGDYQSYYTLGCLPDWNAKYGEDGSVTLVISSNADVQKAAKAKGVNVLNDTRVDRVSGKTMESFAFFIRNILPTCAFAKQQMYAGDYCPAAVICSAKDYLAGNCQVPANGDCSLGRPAEMACP